MAHVRSEHPEGAWAVRVLRRLCGPFQKQLPPGELSVLVVDDASIRQLNKQWRRKNKPTDVLSFPQNIETGLLGDVIISLDTARRQADEGGRPLSDELARLLAHGVLHLCGHDHEIPAEAEAMAKAEVKLLGMVGLVGEALQHPQQTTFRRVRRPAAAGARR